jgi:peroxiredoxin
MNSLIDQRTGRISMIFLFFLICFLPFKQHAQAYKIKLQVKGAHGQKAQFGYYQGDKQYIIQNSVLDKNGKTLFEGKDSLPTGVYLIVIDSIGFFDFFIRNEAEFSIFTEKENLQKTLSVKGSEENHLFFNYQKEVFNLKFKISEIDTLLSKQGNTENPGLKGQKNALEQELFNLVAKYKESYPKSYLTKILTAMDISNPDSMDFRDPELLRTPFYHNMIRLFIKKNINFTPAYIKQETSKLLAKIKGNEANYQYTLGYLINFYNSFYKNGINDVFVYLADQYFLPDKANWLNMEALKSLKDRRDFLAQGLPGMPAADLTLESTTGEYFSLFQTGKKISFLYFWSVGCGHCATSTKILLDNYQALLNVGVQIFAVNIDKDKEAWIKKVEENGLPWINCYDPQQTSAYRDKYYVYGTPLLFAIDENKKIFAVKNGEVEIEELVKHLIKN